MERTQRATGAGPGRRIRLASALLAAGMLLAGCSNAGSGASSAPTTAPTTAAQPTALVTPAPASNAPAETAAASGPTLEVQASSVLGDFLVDGDGRSLYLFMPDEGGAPTCTGSCAGSWPPFLVEDGETVAPGDGVTAAIATVAHPDGGMQVTYAGHPLYYFAADSEPGDTNGQGVNEVWYLVQPSGEKVPGGGRGSY